MRLFQSSKKQYSGQREHFKSIQDLPIGRWNKINSTSDYGYLLKVYQPLKENEIENYEKIWAEIFDEYISEFGLSEDYIDYLRNLKHLTMMKAEQLIQFESIRDAEITILEVSMAQDAEVKTDSFGKTLSMISKYMGYRIDSEVCSVYEFNNHLALIKEGVKVN